MLPRFIQQTETEDPTKESRRFPGHRPHRDASSPVPYHPAVHRVADGPPFAVVQVVTIRPQHPEEVAEDDLRLFELARDQEALRIVAVPEQVVLCDISNQKTFTFASRDGQSQRAERPPGRCPDGIFAAREKASPTHPRVVSVTTPSTPPALFGPNGAPFHLGNVLDRRFAATRSSLVRPSIAAFLNHFFSPACRLDGWDLHGRASAYGAF